MQQRGQDEARRADAAGIVVAEALGFVVDLGGQGGQAGQPGVAVVGARERLVAGEERQGVQRQPQHLVDHIGRVFLREHGDEAVVAEVEGGALGGELECEAGGARQRVMPGRRIGRVRPRERRRRAVIGNAAAAGVNRQRQFTQSGGIAVAAPLRMGE